MSIQPAVRLLASRAPPWRPLPRRSRPMPSGNVRKVSASERPSTVTSICSVNSADAEPAVECRGSRRPPRCTISGAQRDDASRVRAARRSSAQSGQMTLTSACLRSCITASRARASAPASSSGCSTRSPCPPCARTNSSNGGDGSRVGEEVAVVLAGGAVLEHRQRRAPHRAVAAVVEDHGQHRQVELVADPVAHGRIGEHVGAVADRRDDELVGRRELGAERGAQPPAEAAGRAQRR